MKKTCLLVAAVVVMIANSAMADSIAGKFGVTARGGFIVPADSEDVGVTVSSDAGWAVGGGLIYGITENIAADLDVTHSEFDQNELGFKLGTAKTTDIAFGLQYRFMPKSALVPYVGAGVDIILNDFDVVTGLISADIDTSVGGHLSAGVDYFITKQVALNAEFKGVLGTTNDIKVGGIQTGAKFDPSNFSGLFGVRIFFK